MRKHTPKTQIWSQGQAQAVIPFPERPTADMMAKSGDALTIVAFHTDDDFYTHEAKRMCASAQRLGMSVQTTVVVNQGDWVKNTSMKAGFLEQARENIRGALLYVDVDSVFHRSPSEYMAQLDCDIAVHYDDKKGHLMSGTLYFPDTPKALQLIKIWNRQCQLNPGTWDQKVLEDILSEDAQNDVPQYRVCRLPVVFCWVFDREANVSHQGDMPVYIEQLQASRELKEQHKVRGIRRFFSRLSDKTQRRIERIQQIEHILFPRTDAADT